MSYNEDSVAASVGRLISYLIWGYTIIVFLLKLTRWIDWSWWSVFMPLIVMYVLAFILLGLGLSLQAAGNRAKRKQTMGYAMPDLSHIQPLDSIKNPRKS